MTPLWFPPKRLRVIDGLIAEHWLEWKWFSALGDSFLIPPSGQDYCRRFHVHWTEGLRSTRWSDRMEKSYECKKRYDIEHCYSDDKYGHWVLPKFTMDRCPAFLLLEKIGVTEEVTFTLRDDPHYKGLWHVRNEHSRRYGLAKTLPLAVCLFALNLKEIEFPWKRAAKT